MENYFNYFTEIEEHFQRRRGSILLLSTLDWALIETWKEAGVPLQAVLRGIDEAFDRYDQRPSKTKTRKVNSLAYCAQAVLAAAEEMTEAAVGATSTIEKPKHADDKFMPTEIGSFLRRNAGILVERSGQLPSLAQPAAAQAAASLQELAESVADSSSGSNAKPRLEELEQRLTVLEERIFAALIAAQSEQDLLQVRTEVDREMAPYRGKMSGSQMEQLRKQYIHKRLLERYELPRLSLFYM